MFEYEKLKKNNNNNEELIKIFKIILLSYKFYIDI